MPVSDLFRGAPSVAKLVDAIPADCGGRKCRRRTFGTEDTGRFGTEDDVRKAVVVAVSEDSEDESCVGQTGNGLENPSWTPCSPTCVETPEDDDFLDLSIEKLLLRSSRSNRLVALLEENQHALKALFAPMDESTFDSHQDAKPSTVTSFIHVEAWKSAGQFEIGHSVPGVAAMLLYCVGHASIHELLSNLVYGAVDQAPDHVSRRSLYGIVLFVGCLLARGSGLIWHFTGPLAYKRVKWDYHNRVRLGAVDARCLHWLHKRGESVVAVLNMVAYYLCYVAMYFFVAQLAIYWDQKESLLAALPSALYKEALAAMTERGDTNGTAVLQCPTHDHSPDALFGNTNGDAYWDPPACLGPYDLEIFGPEDDEYLAGLLSKNSYDHFVGQEFEVPLFDTAHQMLFYASVAAAAIYTAKVGLGFNFGSGW